MPQLLVRQEEDYTPLLLGAGIGALIGGIVLYPVMSGSDTACAGWVVTGGLLGALAGSLL
jgi:presenilin-like A22 family membrane protease